MPTAFITTWDSYTNAVKQHYLPVNFTQWQPPAGEPIVLHSYTAKVVQEAVAPYDGTDFRFWDIENVWKPDDEHLVICLRHKTDHTKVKTYAVRWHY